MCRTIPIGRGRPHATRSRGCPGVAGPAPRAAVGRFFKPSRLHARTDWKSVLHKAREPDVSDNRAELLARLGAEQREHWRAGQRILVEEFLARYPALEADEAGLVDLIVGEIQLRQRLGETPSHDEYLRRFPHYHTQLASYFAPRARHSPTTMAPDHPPTHSPPAAAARPSPSISDVAILASMPPSEEGGSSG